MENKTINLLRLSDGRETALEKWIVYPDGWYGYTKTNLAAKPLTAMSEANFYSNKEWTERGCRVKGCKCSCHTKPKERV